MDLHRWREFHGRARFDIGGDPNNDDVTHRVEVYVYGQGHLAWPQQDLGSIGSLYYLTMDPFEKYDMVFNGAMASRMPKSSPGQYAGEDNGWVLALIYPVIIDFDKSIMKYPSIKRFPGGASNDLRPNLQASQKPGAGCSIRANRRKSKAAATKRLSGDTTLNSYE